MTLVQRKFAAGLITLFIVSCTSYTGQTAQQSPDDCNGDRNLVAQIQGCLESKGILVEKLCVTKDRIEVVLKAGTSTQVACSVLECILLHTVGDKPGYDLTISIAPSTPGAQAESFYKGHTGTGSIPDSLCGADVLALILTGTLDLKHEVVERKVSEDAKLLSVRLDKLRVEVVSKCKDGKPCLQVSGIASASRVSESRVRGIVVVLVNKYTGILRINTDNLKIRINTDYLKAPPQSGKDSRIK